VNGTAPTPSGGPGAFEAFRIDGPLPTPGLTLIEASAGTGKTWTLTSLVVRFVAEGIPLADLLAVTFTRMATGELRDRTRARLNQVQAALSARLAGAPGGDDPLVECLVGRGQEAVALLSAAQADFDSATIATTHGFCQMVLHGLGSAGDVAAGTVLLEDPSGLVTDVVDDLYLSWTLHQGELPFDWAAARMAVGQALAHPGVPLFDHEPGQPAAELGRFVAAARAEVERRLLAGAVLTYDQILARLDTTLADPDRGPEARRRLQQRFRVVLVDEFQDTDPVQWAILRRAFTGPGTGTRLVLIGDPKQSIYGFRGADVHSYLEAASRADRTWTLTDCRRSDQPVLDAIAALFQPGGFGDPNIPFRTVRAAPDRPPCPLPGAALRIRVVPDSAPWIARTPKAGYHVKPSAVAWVAQDVAADIRGLLAADARRAGSGGRTEPLRPSGVAVLTRTNDQAQRVRQALRDVGVPAVLVGTDSVLSSDAARAWLCWLDAVAEPWSRSHLAALALSDFVGWSAEEVALANDDRWDDLREGIAAWAAVLARNGVLAAYRAAVASRGVPASLLAVEGGERRLTDLGHVAELLDSATREGYHGPAALRAWLAERVAAAGTELRASDERSRRIDSDAAAVQVMTVHRAKGLEFDVVYCPYLWDGPGSGRRGPVVYMDQDTGRRTLDAGPARGTEPPAWREHRRASEAEAQAEDLREMYVALTRARHRLVVWWARTQGCGYSPLGQALLSDRAGSQPNSQPAQPKLDLVLSAIDRVRRRAPGAVSVERANDRPGARLSAPPRAEATPPLEVARLERTFDSLWRRASYSSVTAGAHGSHDGPVSSEPEQELLDDEPEPDRGDGPVSGEVSAPAAGPPGGQAQSGQAVPGQAPVTTQAAPGGSDGAEPAGWPGLPAGTAFGTFVHRVLETTDFAARPLTAELGRAVAAARPAAQALDVPSLVAGLQSALETPLGGPLGRVSLAEVERTDRLDELGFELPVAGGDQPRGHVTPAQLAAVIGSHLDPGDPLVGYPDRLRDRALSMPLRGYLVGSLDLVFRRTGPAGQPRWYVCDYKTNRLDGPPAVAYRTEALTAEMIERHYPLQALFYLVALHRYLRWRQPGYRPSHHLGGAYYLFLRGMTGPAAEGPGGSVAGVFHWDVPPPLVEALSDHLDHRHPGGSG
jgi:exodeoxyribonuclease V beta subunit